MKRSRQQTAAGQTSQGFTLIELMVVLAIAAIVLALAAPSFTGTIERNRRESAMTELATTLQLAKAAAASNASRAPVIVCISKDGASCTGGGDWAAGWIIFTDVNGNNQFDQGAANDGELVGSTNALPDGFSMTPTTGEFTEWIRFRPTGEVEGNGGGTNGRFMICSTNSTGADAKYLVVTATGQVRTDKQDGDTCPNGK